jgi:hypothetical protein
MPLQVGRVGEPPSRHRVEMSCLGDLTAVACALPREHRACVAGVDCVLTGSVEASIPVQQQGSGELRKARAEKRKDEQLIPEDVPAIGLAVQSPRRDPDVQTDGVVRHRLEEREDLQVKRPDQGAVVAEFDATALPGVPPAHDVTIEEVVEASSQTPQGLGGLLGRLGDGGVA